MAFAQVRVMNYQGRITYIIFFMHCSFARLVWRLFLVWLQQVISKKINDSVSSAGSSCLQNGEEDIAGLHIIVWLIWLDKNVR